MAIRHLDSFTCYFMNSDTEKKFPTLEAAMNAAAAYCGNRSFLQPFPRREQTYLCGSRRWHHVRDDSAGHRIRR